jgi:DNA (cytosine-5)-methyltransferase 1
MKIGSLFSGVGGLDLAVESVFGAKPAWFCEWDAKPSRVLTERFPGIPNFRDVSSVDWTQVEPVDIITGGVPCQDVSIAGPRNGMREGTRTGLWSAMRDAVEVIRPQYVVFENVKGLLSGKADSAVERAEGRVGGLRALGRVLGDLATLGYDARWGVVRASDAGLAHRRERVFVLASSDPNGFTLQPGQDGAGLVGSGVPTQESQPAALSLPRAGAANGQDEERAQDYLVRYRSYSQAVERHAALYGPPPEPLNEEGDLAGRFTEWMMGYPVGWVSDLEGFTEEDVRKMMGNAVAPPQGRLALNLLLD